MERIKLVNIRKMHRMKEKRRISSDQITGRKIQSSIPGRVRKCYIPRNVQTALGPTQPPNERVLGVPFLVAKETGA
jgi:hypothetical protein